eukprot:63149_1
MGTKLCIQTPPDDEPLTKTYSFDSDYGEPPNPIIRCKTKLTQESELNSTDLRCDPKESFRTNIHNICKRKRLPFLSQIHRYKFYIWSSNKYGFGHDSIVIGSHDDSDSYGYITAELCVDIDEQTVFPNTRYLSQDEGRSCIKNNKWKYQYSYTTTLNAIVQLILDLIRHHGQYSNLHNGCQHFVEAFLHKIIIAEHQYRIYKILQSDKRYQTTTNKYIRGMRRYKAHNKAEKELKKERLCVQYDTIESTLQLAGTALVVPVLAMAISKETVKDERHRVQFACGSISV